MKTGVGQIKELAFNNTVILRFGGVSFFAFEGGGGSGYRFRSEFFSCFCRR